MITGARISKSASFEIKSARFDAIFMISGGVQTAWKNLNETPSFELLFNIDLYGMNIGRRPM
jgi:hypothetical protein